MFGIFREAKAFKSATAIGGTFLNRPEALGPLPDNFWSDPYFLGFFSKLFALVVHFSTEGKLTSFQKGKVQMRIDNEFGIPTETSLPLIEKFMRDGHTQFLSGSKNAELMFFFTEHPENLMTEPEILDAIKFAKDMEAKDNVSGEEIFNAMRFLMFDRRLRSLIKGD